MICKSCDLNEICKLYEYLGKQRYAEVDIKSCKFNPEKVKKGIEMHERHKTVLPNPAAIASYTGHAKPDLRDAEKKVLNIPDKPESIKINCPGCKILTYDDELSFCTKCGDPICSDCGTAVDGQKLCPKCWKSYGQVEDTIEEDKKE